MSKLAAVPQSSHHVQFYDSPGFLAAQVAEFLRDSLSSGGTSVLVARPDHVTCIEQDLRTRGIDVEGLRASGRLVVRDAAEMLATFMVDGMPDRDRFRATIEAVLAAATEPLHVYGEMVDVLSEHKQSAAMIELEALWNDLARDRTFSLLCGYQLNAFADERERGHFVAVCAHHDTVAPSEQFASLAGLEQRARSLETEIQRRERLEQRVELLLEVGGELAGTTTYDEVARLTLDKGKQAIDAAAASLWMLDHSHGKLRMLDGSLHEQYRDIGVLEDAPIAAVIRTGEPLFFGSLEDYHQQFPASLDRARPSLVATDRAFAMLPLVTNAGTIGVLCFTYDHPRTFSSADRAYKVVLARQCALALERIQLQDQERALRRDAELLYELIAAVNRIDDAGQVFELALDAVARGTRSERSAILLFDPDGVMRFKASRGLSDTYLRAVEGHSPWEPDEADATPVTVEDTETDPAWLSYRPVFRAEGIRAIAFVPLVHQRKLIGKFMLYRDEPRAFSARDLQLTATIAVHVAQAVERNRAAAELSRAYAEEREAHHQAEAATRAREEILSVVSHDLRSPVTAVLMGANVLLGDTGTPDRTRKIVERIQRQADRIARQIEDLVDFAGIQAGRLALERAPHSASEILAAATDLFGPLAQERGLKLETRALPDLPPIQCDSERVVQILSNLMANALKVTPKGGEIAIGAEPKEQDVVFYVRDTGPGIEPDEMPNLFERFWRGKASSYRGAGLGLSIARGIVDAHGGRIWAESQVGVGSTFYFSLS